MTNDVDPGAEDLTTSLLVDQLLKERLIAALATTEPSGKIHLVPMWFRREGDHILLPTSSRSRKARNVSLHPHASVMIHQTRSAIDVRGVMIRGAVQIIRGAEARDLNRSIHTRYIAPSGLARELVATTLVASDDITLNVRMEEVTAWDLTGLEMVRELREHGESYALS